MHPAEKDPRFFHMLTELWRHKSLKGINGEISKDALRRVWCKGITDVAWLAAAERDEALNAAIDNARRR